LLERNRTGFTHMRAEMARNLKEMAQRFYSGDLAAVDEFLQLYCIGETERAAVVAATDAVTTASCTAKEAKGGA
jgi:hypothetical protein